MPHRSRSTQKIGHREGARGGLFALLWCWWALMGVERACALEADELLLIANKNVGQGGTLAQFYAEKRQVPAGRVLELNLPITEEMSADVYDREVVPVVREFLRSNGLERKVKCIVTFYGVPLRISARQNTAKDREELAAQQGELKQLPAQVEPMVMSMEKAAAGIDATFQAKAGADLDSQARRAEAALKAITTQANKTVEPAERERLLRLAVEKLAALVGPAGMVERHLLNSGTTTQPTSQASTQGVQKFVEYRAELMRLQDRRFEAGARRALREMVRENSGPFEFGRLLQSQIAYFQTENTGAAFDSELAMLWWDYPRSNWINNPLHYGVGVAHLPVVMTMRLDGAQTGTVSQIILASLRAESEGLKGKVVIDSRGIPAMDAKGKPDPYGMYDQTLRDLADLVQAKTKLSMVLDDRPEVMAAHAVSDVAVYMGWYSVSRYVPACEFRPGAVGFHLASFTMVTLRREDPRCWARELLNDGMAATLGAVAEPYLSAFPRADDFFPLLFTGKLTLAEVYWKTTPMSSWMITMIGDPLYTPYQKNPALAVGDLPDRLKEIFAEPRKTDPSGTGPWKR